MSASELAADLILLAAVASIVAGVAVLTSLGWTLIAAGVLVAAGVLRAST